MGSPAIVFIALSSFAVALLFGSPAPALGQLQESMERGPGGKWIVADALGYGALGFGLGVLASRAVDGSGGGPAQPSASAQLSGGSPWLSYAIGSPNLVSAPDGTTIAIVGATTVAGTVAGTLIGRRAFRIIAAGGSVGRTHRAAVFGGAVLAGGTLGALTAVPLIDREGEGTPLGSDEQTVALLAASGAALGGLFVLWYRHDLGAGIVSVTPTPVGTQGGVHVRVTW